MQPYKKKVERSWTHSGKGHVKTKAELGLYATSQAMLEATSQ
jgi:hypothetical protein